MGGILRALRERGVFRGREIAVESVEQTVDDRGEPERKIGVKVLRHRLRPLFRVDAHAGPEPVGTRRFIELGYAKRAGLCSEYLTRSPLISDLWQMS